jgi:hypothetical protein
MTHPAPIIQPGTRIRANGYTGVILSCLSPELHPGMKNPLYEAEFEPRNRDPRTIVPKIIVLEPGKNTARLFADEFEVLFTQRGKR